MRLVSKPIVLAMAAGLLPALHAGGAPVATGLAAASARPASQAAPGEARPGLAGLPLTFQPNRGQAPAAVRYLGQTQGVTALFTRTGVTLRLSRPARRGVRPGPSAGLGGQAQVTLAFEHASARVRVTGAGRQPGTVSYFLGKTKKGWHTGIPAYAQVVYHGLWPGIDAGFTARGGTLRYWFTLAPTASTSEIQLAYPGARALRPGPSGALEITTTAGVLHDQAPTTIQTVAGRRSPLTSRYRLSGGTRFGFTTGRRSPGATVTIDPGLEYGTYLGGSVADSSLGPPVTDAAGDLYVFGETASPDFPTTPGAYQRKMTAKVGGVFFVTKFNPDGTGLLYSTFVGGSNLQTLAFGAVDSAGDAYVTGVTESADFPITRGAYRTTPYVSLNQSVVFKLNPTGSRLLYSTYLAPDLSYSIDSQAIAVVPDGSVIVTGITDLDYAPTTPGAFQTSYPGGWVAGYVARLNPSGSGLIYATYLGAPITRQTEVLGNNATCVPTAVTADGEGSAYIPGQCVAGFPTTPGAYQTKAGPGGGGLLVKLAPSGRRLKYATYWGTGAVSCKCTPYFYQLPGAVTVAIDSKGDAYVAGNEPAGTIPVTKGAYQSNCKPNAPQSDDLHPDCAGVAEFNPQGTRLLYSSYFGGNNDTGPIVATVRNLAVDASGRMYLVGDASAGMIPTTPGAYQPAPGDFAFPFYLAVLGKGSLLYSTFFGGAGSVCVQFCFSTGNIDIAAHPASGSVYLSGTAETGMPISPGAFQQTYPGGFDTGWAAKLGLPSLSSGG